MRSSPKQRVFPEKSLKAFKEIRGRLVSDRDGLATAVSELDDLINREVQEARRLEEELAKKRSWIDENKRRQEASRQQLYQIDETIGTRSPAGSGTLDVTDRNPEENPILARSSSPEAPDLHGGPGPNGGRNHEGIGLSFTGKRTKYATGAEIAVRPAVFAILQQGPLTKAKIWDSLMKDFRFHFKEGTPAWRVLDPILYKTPIQREGKLFRLDKKGLTKSDRESIERLLNFAHKRLTPLTTGNSVVL